jgi:hypothetical protein
VKKRKMFPRNPTTRCSAREPKFMEAEVGEGSSPNVARQLEFATKEDPIIKTSTKKEFSQPPAFGDMMYALGQI